MASTHALRFLKFPRFALFRGRIGDDGLTRRERKRMYREYMGTAGRKSSQAEMDALKARLKARHEEKSRNTEV